MKRGIPIIRAILTTLRRSQRGFTSIEAAIVIVAFVVVGSVFAYTIITTGLFSSEKSQQSAQAGVLQAKSTVLPKGSMILSEAQSSGSHTGPSNAAMLTDGGAGFIAEGVVKGDTIRNVTDGSSGTVDIVTATTITLNPALAGGADNDWDVIDSYEVDMDSVGTIKFRMIPSPSADTVRFVSNSTLVSFSDANTSEIATYAATFPTPLVDNVYWSTTWLKGVGPGLEVGEEVEFSVNVKNLAAPLLANQRFSVEIIPQTGAAISYSRVTPLEMTKVMDVN